MKATNTNVLLNFCNLMANKCDGIVKSIWEQFAVMIDMFPNISIVNCKDCIHSPAAHDDCPLPVQYITPDGYCHLGRGKDEQSEI